MRIKNKRRAGIATAAVLSLALVGCVEAPEETEVVSQPETTETDTEADVDPCEALSGKRLTLTVTFGPGGGYDTYARLLAPELGEAINAEIIVENKEGAGGLLAVNSLIASGRTDGTEFLIMNGVGTVASVLAEAEGADFSLDDLSYIGRVASDDAVLVTGANSGYKTIEDVLTKEGFTFGSTGPGSSNYVWPAVLMEAFDLEASGSRIISGFGGSGEITLAVVQGNVSGYSGTSSSILGNVESGELIPLLGLSDRPTAAMGDSPLIEDLELTQEQSELLNTHLIASLLGRVLVGPADMDTGALQCLRDGLDEVVNDEEFIAEALEAGLPFSYVAGDAVQTDIIDALRDLPESYLSVLKAAY